MIGIYYSDNYNPKFICHLYLIVFKLSSPYSKAIIGENDLSGMRRVCHNQEAQGKIRFELFFQFLYMSCSRLSYPNHSTLLVLKFQVQSFKKKVSSSNNIINMHFSLILIILLYLILIRELSNALFLCLIEHVYTLSIFWNLQDNWHTNILQEHCPVNWIRSFSCTC